MANENGAPARTRGPGLRTKLALGFVVLLAILAAVGTESISLLDRLGGSIDVILRENYKSVIACERMKESLERMDSGALFALAGEAPQGRALAAQNRPRFAAALQTELGNITLPGEGERAARLRQLFTAYVPTLQRVLTAEVPLAERRALYFQQLYPTFQQVKTTADEILRMNQQNMVQANDRARRLARDATRHMALLLLAGTAVAGLCILFLSGVILGPLARLTRAARAIESGNLDVAVPVTSRDELGQLAAAFNAMAGSLRELRETDQAHLLRARRISQSAIDHLPAPVAVLSPDRRVELANRAAATLLDLRPGEPLPERHAAWLPPLLERAESERLPEGGLEQPVRLAVEGRQHLFLPRASVLRDRHGHSEGVLLALDDATGRLRGREVHASLLANAARDLERSLAPLRAGLESVETERLGPLTPRQKQRLAEARAEAERLGAVAAGLQAMSRLEERRQQLHLEAIPARDLVHAAVRGIADRYREKRVELAVDVDPEAPLALVDRERAELLLPALLRNALAHTPGGGAVTVRAEPWEGRVRCSVTDTGSGVPPAYRELIFEPLYQVPGTEDAAGAGLGLTIARDVVQAHGGEIHCESEEGRESTFWFTLPVSSPALD
jgi:two-component system, NtrC family, sensor histidine kinase KinB